MSNDVTFYQEQIQANLSKIQWLAKMQKEALKDFSRLGFPTRHQEDWKYTSLDLFLKNRFYVRDNQVPHSEPAQLPFQNMYTLYQGQLPAELKSLPAGVIVMSLQQAIQEGKAPVESYLNKILPAEHAFQVLNTGLIDKGVFIYIPAGVQVADPIVLTHWQDQMGQAVYLRHLVIAEAGSRVRVIEDYQGRDDTAYLTNTVTEIYLAEQAQVDHCKIQREGAAAYHFGHVAVRQSQQSQFTNHSCSFGGKWTRSDMTIDMQEPEAHCVMNGVYALDSTQHIDHHTLVNHSAPHCHSEQDYKGILSGKSRAVFNGRVVVAKGAQRTEAKQQNKNLLLSEQTEIDTKPQLEIFADDVICTHGATVGQLDEDALFYLATRGIVRQQAHRYLVQAFAADNVQRLPYIELSVLMRTLLDQKVG